MSAVSTRSRRAVLAAAAGAAAATAGAAITAPVVALAAGDDGRAIHVGDDYDQISLTTTLNNLQTEATVLVLESAGNGIGLDVTAGAITEKVPTFNPAIRASSLNGNAVQAFGHVRAAVTGWSKYGDGIQGTALKPNVSGVYGVNHDVDGYGVFGRNTGSDGSTGYFGHSGVGAGGQSDKLTGVLGYSGTSIPSAQLNTGVYGVATTTGGRGGQFAGAAAQIRLQPAAAATHPASGERGDFFVDSSGTLWYCKGGGNWHQLA